MALRGTLRDFSLGEILQLISFQRKTGVLSVEGEEDTVSVSFLDGKVVAADSLKRRFENRLGNLLVRAGKLTPAVLNEVLEEQKRLEQRIGFVLINRGLVSPGDLQAALRTQILNLIYRLFRWKDGRYYFSQEKSVEYEVDHFTPVATENILMEAARMSDEWPLIQSRIPSLDIVFRRAPGTEKLEIVSEEDEKPPGTLAVPPEEAIVWKLIDGKRTVTEITEATFLSDFDVVKALDRMLARHLIVEAEPEKAVPPPASSPPPEPAKEVIPPNTPAALVLWGVLAALLLLSVVFLPRNSLNFVLSGARGSYLAPVENSISVAWLQRLDRGLEVFYLNEGFYPATLAELASAAVVEGAVPIEAGTAGYRYILRVNDNKYDLYGKTLDGKLDPSLSLSRTLDPVARQAMITERHRKAEARRKPVKIDVVN
ncbi:MAG TPA: DUF4388 domain-containing protein [Thermoanaerobaculia bacterium]|nr:DUF4388 domain-containing protein [Thermoanaerobaculia bacterium]